ncbi:uncharacterized protein LOC130678185 [Microplitis mediator]|uniref:uncharacterized protein LOC130678185 n=1 Tax=Microplitis mediator TaxID=375433 RepID=UPI00255327EA|nr:uncharacterized protein LOC130678185 [Microplitis mediator]
MSEPRKDNDSETRQNRRRADGVDIHESIETLIPFTKIIKEQIQEFRKEFKETYEQYLKFIKIPQSRIQQQSSVQSENQSATPPESKNEFGRKVQYSSFHKVGKIYDTTIKSLGDFMTTFTEDSRNLYSIAIKISSLKQEFNNLVTRYENRTDDLEVNQLYQINKKIDSIIEHHNKLVITYNAEIDHFIALQHNLSNGILVYESTTGKNFVLSKDDDLEEFKRLVETDEISQKRSPIYASFASRFKDDLQNSADKTVLMPVKPLKKNKWILPSPVEQDNDASEQTQRNAQNSEDPGPDNQEYQPSQQNTEFNDATEHHTDPSVPNNAINATFASRFKDDLQNSADKTVLMPVRPLKNNNWTLQSAVEQDNDASEQTQHHAQNSEDHGPDNQEYQPSQQNTEFDDPTEHLMDTSVPNAELSSDVQQTYQEPMGTSPSTSSTPPSNQIHQSSPQSTEFNEASEVYLDQQPSPHFQSHDEPSPSDQVRQPSQQSTEFDEATENYRDHVRNVQHITNVQQTHHEPIDLSLSTPSTRSNYEPLQQMSSSSPNIEKEHQYPRIETRAIKDNEQTSPVSMVSMHPPLKTRNRIRKPAKPSASKSQAVLNLIHNPELSISLVQPTQAPVSRYKRYRNLRRSSKLPTPASKSVTQPISSTEFHSKTEGDAANPLPSENLKTQPVASVDQESAYPTIKDLLARTDITIVPVSRNLPNQDHDAPSRSGKIPPPIDRSAKSHSDIEAAKSPQPTPVRNLDVNESNINPDPPIDENISLDHDQQKLPQSENSEQTDPNEEPSNKKSKLESESEQSFDELSNQSMDIVQSSREPLIINENSNLKVQQNNNEPNQKEESQLSEEIVDPTEDSDEDLITIQESTNIDKSNDSRETDTVEEVNLPKNVEVILGKDVITKSEINHLKRFLSIFKEIHSRDSYQLREVQSLCDDKIIMKGIEGSNRESLEMEIQKLEKRGSDLKRKIKYIGKIVLDITEKINKSEVNEESKSEQVIDLTDDSNKNITTIQESTNINESNDSRKTDTTEDSSAQKLRNILGKDEITESDIEFLKKLLQKIEQSQNYYSNQLDEVQRSYDKIAMKEKQGSNYKELEIEIQKLEEKRQELERKKAINEGQSVRITEKINKSEVKGESKLSEQVINLTDDSDEDITTIQESTNIDKSNDSQKTDPEEDYYSIKKIENTLDKDELTESDFEFLMEVLKGIVKIQNHYSNELDEVQRSYDKIAMMGNQGSNYKDLEIEIQELEGKRQEVEKQMKKNARLSVRITEKINRSTINEEPNDNQGQSFEETSEQNVTVVSPPNLVTNQMESDSVTESDRQSDEQTTVSSDSEQKQDITAQPEVVTKPPAKMKRKLSIDSEEATTKISKSDQSKSSDDQHVSGRLQMKTRSSTKGESKFSIDNTSEESNSGSKKSETLAETTREQLAKWMKTEKDIKLLVQKLAAEAKKGNIKVNPKKEVKELLWVNENFVQFLKKHIYLLAIKDTKIRTIKSLCEKIFTDVMNHEIKIQKDSAVRLNSSLTVELYETYDNNKRKEAQLKYLQNKLILSEISYYYYNYMRNQIYDDVVKLKLGASKITNDEKWQLIEALRCMNKNAAALKFVKLKTEKENIIKIRNKIKTLKKELKLLEDERNLRLNNLRNEVTDIDDNINGKIYQIVELKTELSKSSITVKQDKQLELKKCETELKNLQSAHKIALKKYMSSDE